MTAHDHEVLIARQKITGDGAIPDGNSVAVLCLFRLAQYASKDQYAERGRHALKGSAQGLPPNGPRPLPASSFPTGFSSWRKRVRILMVRLRSSRWFQGRLR
ncbi:hypothetical protein [Desulfobacula sp.]|uniref:hypothetical protein n=1 Tax=Desulfobacula sp. TaxID=2593537 RepID=UPI00260C00D1|nr:hypothetical protein [Desulfobacula sp.]